MFYPGTYERERDERSKKEILLEMKKFCEHYKAKPLKVFECKHGVYFVFTLPDQNLTEDKIWESPGIKNIRQFFTDKGYCAVMKRWFFRTGFWNDLKIGKDKIHIYIGLVEPKNFLEILKEKVKEIIF